MPRFATVTCVRLFHGYAMRDIVISIT
ncbi:hypothetical protein [Xanthomonas phage Xp15]|uniref:Uncharacterized protein n=1 Tax=Xanthomonas phage Xp15 TaxID=322855 RepID=Q52PT4_9CAUD|nr:hypothetical protein XPXV15_gp77 [Xanthomonas phage Xp15]AAX84923.1 hypothetical protein [Xanthomonas phage Xp15]